MKEVILNRMRLINFKGAKDTTIEFKPDITRIFGNNETGKTTLFDAFTWALFGKDSTGRSDSNFAIKTLDKNNQVIEKIDHVVELELSVNGETMNLKRTYRERWVKKRGNEETEFSGHETVYEWNEVPLKKSEYEDKIRNIIDESVFKLVTDPHAFASLHWEAQRKLLIDIAGNVEDKEVLESEKQFKALINQLTGKTLEELQAEKAAKRRRINDELKMIPTRIDEVKRGLPEIGDTTELKKEKEKVEAEISALEKSILNANAQDEAEEAAVAQLRVKRNNLTSKKDRLEQDIKAEVTKSRNKLLEKYTEDHEAHSEKSAELRSVKTQIENASTIISEKSRVLDELEPRLQKLRNEYDELNKSTYQIDPNDKRCPTCKQELPQDQSSLKIEQLTAMFNTEKAERLAKMNKDGKDLLERVNSAKAVLKENQDKLPELKREQLALEKIVPSLSSVAEDSRKAYEEFDAESKSQEAIKSSIELAAIEKEIAEVIEAINNRPGADTGELEQNLRTKKERLSQIVHELQAEDIIEKGNARIDELAASEKAKAQEMASIEKEQFLIDEFVAKKTTMLQEKVNAKFEMVNFKMFEIQINGGLSPTCKAVFKGVDIADVNNAGQIQAGIDIIRTLCGHYHTYCPIWVDNAESITVIPQTKSQQIHLLVSEDYKELTVL